MWISTLSLDEKAVSYHDQKVNEVMKIIKNQEAKKNKKVPP
jgi:hypothetical protein